MRMTYQVDATWPQGVGPTYDDHEGWEGVSQAWSILWRQLRLQMPLDKGEACSQRSETVKIELLRLMHELISGSGTEGDTI